MLSFLKNKVGRPSKEILRKRRLFYLICALLIVLFIAVGTYTLTSNANTSSSFQAFDLDKLTGNVSSIGKEALNITYIDNVKNDSAAKNSTISIKEKFSYTGSDKIYYRLDLNQNNRTVAKGTCREVNNNKLATVSFKLTKDKLNVITGIYSDSNCKKMLSRYGTKKYYISDNKEIENEAKLPSIELPKYSNTWYAGDSSETFSLNVVPTSSTVKLTSSNPEIMEVIQYGINSFRLEAKNAGKVTITATSSSGVDASVTYTVKEKLTITCNKLPEIWQVGAYGNAIFETSINDSVVSVTSSNPSVMSIEKISDNVYKLNAKKRGTVTITATSKNGAKKSYTYKVEEKASISIPNYNSVLTVGKSYGKFALSVTPKDSNVTLTSSNPSVVEVVKHSSNSFSLKAKKIGTATITATSSSGVKKTYNYTVIDEVKDISMPKYKDEWIVGESYGKFSVSVSPSDATVQVKSSDSSVIEVVKNATNSWTLKAKKEGTATITASASNGLKTSYTYKVKQPATINMPKFSNELEVGKTYGKFTLTAVPTASYLTVTSSNPSVIQVMKYGDNSAEKNSWGLKALKAGTATIKATANNGAEVVYTYTVKEKTKITMPKYKDELVVGETYGKFSITVTPSNLSVSLISSDTSVIQVMKYGANSWGLKAKKAGTAKITAKASDGATTYYVYTVKEKAKVSIPNYPSEWETGTNSKDFSATVVPSNATVNISSSNSSVMEVVNKGNNKWQLKAKKAGTATITVTSSAGVQATYTYTVKEKPTITMPEYSHELNIGTTYGRFSLETNTPGATVSLISSNTSVIQVMKYGDNSAEKNSWGLKALKAGTATITATSSAGAEQIYEFKVLPNQLTLNGDSLPKSWEYGNQEYLVVNNIYPSNSTVTVKSSNSNVISVSTVSNVSWELKAKGIGNATITVECSNGIKKTYSYTVTEPANQKLISMPKFNDTLEEGVETERFSIKVEPSNAKVYLTSSNTSVIQIIKYGDNSASGNKWSLKAKKAGTATITAESDGVKQVYKYTVKQVKKSISMSRFTENWDSGSSGVINVQVEPANSTVTVTSSNPSVMSVSKISNTQWRITAIGNGTATITASATNGQKTSYTYKVKHEYPSAYEMIKNNNYETKKAGIVTVYFEKTCSAKSKTNIVNFINKLPTYAKKSSQVVYVMTKSTWNKNGYKDGVAGWASTGAVPYIWIPCDKDYSNQSDNYALYHEYGHAVDAHYGAISGSGYISNGKDFVTLYNNTYRYVSQNGCSKKSGKCVILRGYAYTASGEFFAESYMMTVRPMVGYNNNVSGITSNWGPINNKKISPYGTIEEEMKKYIKKVEAVIK